MLKNIIQNIMKFQQIENKIRPENQMLFCKLLINFYHILKFFLLTFVTGSKSEKTIFFKGTSNANKQLFMICQFYVI